MVWNKVNIFGTFTSPNKNRPAQEVPDTGRLTIDEGCFYQVKAIPTEKGYNSGPIPDLNRGVIM